jgi:hypothetical protein
MSISSILPVKQIQDWKNDMGYNGEEKVHVVINYMNEIGAYNQENFPDKTYRYKMRMSLFNKLYEFLYNNPEFLCHTPLFLEKSRINAENILIDLQSIKKIISVELFNSLSKILNKFIDLAVYIELI